MKFSCILGASETCTLEDKTFRNKQQKPNSTLEAGSTVCNSGGEIRILAVVQKEELLVKC